MSKLAPNDPGTAQHIAGNMFAYSFAARMKAQSMMVGQRPPEEDSGFRPTGCHMCCCNMCPCSMFCCTGKTAQPAHQELPQTMKR
jgi:hypothetical protein